MQKNPDTADDIDILISSLSETLDKDVIKTMHIFN